MGQNFYRVIRIERSFSFSASGAKEVYDWLSDQGCLDMMNSNGSGFVDVGVDSLEEMLEELKGIDPGVEKSIKEDIRWARNRQNEFVTYEVF